MANAAISTITQSANAAPGTDDDGQRQEAVRIAAKAFARVFPHVDMRQPKAREAVLAWLADGAPGIRPEDPQEIIPLPRSSPSPAS